MSKRWHSVPLRTHRARQQAAQPDDNDDAIVGHMGEGARPCFAEEEEEQDRRTTPAPKTRNTADSADLIYTGRPPLLSVARRYTDPRGNTIIEQGGRRYILHTEQGQRL